MSELNLPEVQRQAMADLKRAVAWADTSETNASLIQVYKAASELVAANRIPEGAPVGTIARRPDGAWIARKEQCGKWDYRAFTNEGDWPRDHDADSWPVIYDPTRDQGTSLAEGIRQFKDGEGVSSDWLFEGDPTSQQKPVWNQGVATEDDWKEADLTALQEPEAFDRFPGIENVTTADRIGAVNADAQLRLVFKLRDIRIERGLEIADVAAAMEMGTGDVARFESGSTNPRMAMIRRYARAVDAVFTVDVRKWEDAIPVAH